MSRRENLVAIEAADKQEMEADVVVIGYGSAGATAAITAHDNGAKVIVLEKMPAGGGNSRISAGAFFTPVSLDAVQFVETLCGGTTDKEVIYAFVENALQTKDWLREIGGEAHRRPPFVKTLYPSLHSGAFFANIPGAEHTTLLCIKCGETEARAKLLWDLLSSNMESRGIKVITSTPAKELVINKNGEITGVVAENSSGKFLVKAKRAVILTCGGFEYNEAMKESFLPCKPFYSFGSPGNTGDGIIMAQKVGAALWHMPVVEGYLGFKPAEYQAAFAIFYHNEGFIYVNRQGKRFCSETGTDIHHAWRDVSEVDSREITSRPGYPNIPAYAIFDEVTRLSGPLHRSANPSGYNQDYKWSQDNSQEIAKGWIARANTIGELARRISVNASSLENTVTQYNKDCKAGQDAEFGRAKATLRAIEAPPFYAIELWPCLLNTQGGPRRDKQARVLNHEGKPIPRLYAAGELGSIWGFFYHGGSNISECLAFGRIAGRNAAAEKPWS